MKIKFSDLLKGQAVLFNGRYAFKSTDTQLCIPSLGVYGFHYFDKDEELEIEDIKYND